MTMKQQWLHEIVSILFNYHKQQQQKEEEEENLSYFPSSEIEINLKLIVNNTFLLYFNLSIILFVCVFVCLFCLFKVCLSYVCLSYACLCVCLFKVSLSLFLSFPNKHVDKLSEFNWHNTNSNTHTNTNTKIVFCLMNKCICVCECIHKT